MTTALPLVTTYALIDDVLAAFREPLAEDGPGYRGHVYRMFNFARALVADSSQDDTLALAAAFHDLGIWSDGTFDYLEPSAERAKTYIATRRPDLDAPEVARLILLHHKLTRCPPDAGPLAEAFRRADLVDLSLGAVRFGLSRELIEEARAAFPNAGFHRGLVRVGAGWAARHPSRPLPMLKW
jgi:hypothetical protein